MDLHIFSTILEDQNKKTRELFEKFQSDVFQKIQTVFQKETEKLQMKIQKVNEETEKMVYEAFEEQKNKTIRNFCEKVSEKHDIGLKFLMRDANELDEEQEKPVHIKNGYCQGHTKQGKPCSRKAKSGGFCKTHQDQRYQRDQILKRIKSNERIHAQVIKHNHPNRFEFKEDCPACKHYQKKKDEEEEPVDNVGLYL